MEIELVGDWIATINGREEGLMPTLSRSEADIAITPCSANLRFAEKPYGHLLIYGYPYR